jgi:hypothetical protein
MPTVKELRDEAKAKHLKGYSTMNKPQLVQLLSNAAVVGIPAPAVAASSMPSASASSSKSAPKPVPLEPKPPKLRYVKAGEINVDGGEITIVAPELLIGEYTYDKVTDLASSGKLMNVGTGGDGSFAVYAVYAPDQQDNLPQEYRITIADDPYEKLAISDAENDKLLKAGYKHK